MFMTKLYLVGLLFVSIYLTTNAQNTEMTPEVFADFTEEKLKHSLSENWCIERINKTEINLFYCRTFASNLVDTIFSSSVLEKKKEQPIKQISDSVFFESQLNPYRGDIFKQAGKKEEVIPRPDDILKITIRIDELWSDEKMERIKAKNKKLISQLKKDSIYHILVHGQFADCRAYTPIIRIRKKIYKFHQLPYQPLSRVSIFLSNNTPYCFDIYLHDDSPDFKNKRSNLLNRELKETMVYIAYLLELQDYKHIEDVVDWITPVHGIRTPLSSKKKPYKPPHEK